MRRVISLALAAALLGAMPSVADLDAHARATGNQKTLAIRVGEHVFAKRWSAQVMQISANAMSGHVVLGVRLSGVHFHHDLTRDAFLVEIAAVVAECFAAAPEAEEVDLWTTVPLSVGKGIIVAGDLARPTSRTVFTLSVRRGESPSALAARLRSGQNVFVDEEWERAAFKKGA